MKRSINDLSSEQREDFLRILKERFEKNMDRHKNLVWDKVYAKLESNADKLLSLYQMEDTGGEPDVVDYEEATDSFVFFDCAAESPSGRRSLCFDQQALDSRKKNKPENNAVTLATDMGIELLTEEQYHFLQELGNFDMKTSSWVQTAADIRNLGGALFCDFRYGRVFTYHNGAESYYAARGFRGSLKV